MAMNSAVSTNNLSALWQNLMKTFRVPALQQFQAKFGADSSACAKAISEAEQMLIKDFTAAGLSFTDIDRILQTTPTFSRTSMAGMAQGLFQGGPPILCAGCMPPRRGFKTIRSRTDTGLRSHTRKDAKSGLIDEATEDQFLKATMEKHHKQPHVQRQLLESYRRGMTYAMTNLKKSGFAHDTISLYLKRLILLGVVGIIYYSFYVLKGSIVGSGNSPLRPIGEKFEVTERVEITFDDVKGCEEAKQELKDVVEFLRNPDRFAQIGARLPKGVLVSGSPGTGKTLLARAVAGEARVPFLNASGSEFDEIFVGTGAMRIRKLFEEAKARAPCVVFIDEIDAVISRRTSSPSHPYANQTINQLLSEMDGFKPSSGIIIIGATNRRSVLDPAAVRPGRFDIEIKVRPPDIFGRKALLDLYLGKVKHKDIDIEALARGTVSFTGADIANLVNQAAILACLEEAAVITMTHLWKARDKIMYGSASSKPQDEEVNKVTAFHEAGHALVSHYSPYDKFKIHKITLIPHGQALASVTFLPEKDHDNQTYNSLLARLDSLMGGRVAEEILLGLENVTTGPSSDLQKATKIAESIVKNFGMSDSAGLRCFEKMEDVSEKSRQIVDEEVKRLLAESHARAHKILTTHAKEHKLLAEALLKYETLTAEDMVDIINGRKPKVAIEYEKEMKEDEKKKSSQGPIGSLIGLLGGSSKSQDKAPPGPESTESPR